MLLSTSNSEINKLRKRSTMNETKKNAKASKLAKVETTSFSSEFKELETKYLLTSFTNTILELSSQVGAENNECMKTFIRDKCDKANELLSNLKTIKNPSKINNINQLGTTFILKKIIPLLSKYASLSNDEITSFNNLHHKKKPNRRRQKNLGENENDNESDNDTESEGSENKNKVDNKNNKKSKNANKNKNKNETNDEDDLENDLSDNEDEIPNDESRLKNGESDNKKDENEIKNSECEIKNSKTEIANNEIEIKNKETDIDHENKANEIGDKDKENVTDVDYSKVNGNHLAELNTPSDLSLSSLSISETQEEERNFSQNDLEIIPKLTKLFKSLYDFILEHKSTKSNIDHSFDLALISKYTSLILLSISNKLADIDYFLDKENFFELKCLGLVFYNLVKIENLIEVQCVSDSVNTVFLTSDNTLIQSQDDTLSLVVLTLIIDPLIREEITTVKHVVQTLWKNVKNMFVIENGHVIKVRNATGYLLLYYMGDHIFTKEYLDILADPDFFHIIQSGLMSKETMIRKRVVHFLRGAVQFLINRRLKIKKRDSKVVCEFVNFCCDKENTQNLWNDFFMLYDAFEEPQIHIIKPLLSKFNDLVISENCLPITWSFILLQRAFNHINKNIRITGLSYFFALDHLMATKKIITFIYIYLFPALRNYYLFSRDLVQNSVTSPLGDQLVDYISKLFSSCTKFDDDVILLFVRYVCNKEHSLAAVPLFYITRGLASIKMTANFSYFTCKRMIIDYMGCITTHDEVFRSAGQCDMIKFLLNNIKLIEHSLLQVTDLISYFNMKESWIRGSPCWNYILGKLTELPETSNPIGRNSIEVSMDLVLFRNEPLIFRSEAIALGICILLDMRSQASNGPSHSKIFFRMKEYLRICSVRPYINNDQLVWALEILQNCLEIFQKNIFLGEFKLNSSDIDDICCCLENLYSLLMTSNISVQVEYLCLRIIDLSINLKFHKMNSIFNDFTDLVKEVASNFRGKRLPQYNGYFAIEFLSNSFYSFLSKSDRLQVLEIIERYFLPNLDELINKQSRFVTKFNSIKVNYSNKFKQKSMIGIWNSVYALIKETIRSTKKDECKNILDKTLVYVQNTLSCVTQNEVYIVYRLATLLADKFLERNLWETVLNKLWSEAFSFRKTCELFRKLIGQVSEFACVIDAFHSKENHCHIIRIAKEILKLGDTTPEVVSIFSVEFIKSLKSIMKEIKDISIINDLEELLHEIYVPLLMFGNIHQKQWKVIQDTALYIKNGDNMDSFEENSPYYNFKTRVSSIVFLLSLNENSKTDCIISNIIAKGITIQFQSLKLGNKNKEFANSMTHRYKTRLLQAFLLLLPLLSTHESGEHLEWLCDTLITEHQYPSVRYLLEWSISLVVIKHPNLFVQYQEKLQKASKERQSCISSFLVCLMHIGCASNDEDLLSSTINSALPWCMSHQYNTRLHAQIVIHKMFEHCKSNEMISLNKMYQPIEKCIYGKIEQEKNTTTSTNSISNMLNDFYYMHFHPTNHYTLQTIFYELPRLSMLSQDEWTKTDDLKAVKKLLQLVVKTSIKTYNSDDFLSNAQPPQWVTKTVSNNESSPTDNYPLFTYVETVQVKRPSWKSKYLDEKNYLNLPLEDSEIVHSKERNELIVVASLLDKLPNIGGLCRTCEIFNVQQFVIHSTKITDDPAFTALSLTSQQWIPIKEVRRHGLRNYLKEMRSKGYTLIGAEQTNNSNNLEEFKFPKKSLIILGNEKEGIPCDLLQFVDQCVEIKQHGVIKSLNVHVSGALFVWEYMKQHYNSVWHLRKVKIDINPVVINNRVLNRVNQVNFLGLTINDRHTLHVHFKRLMEN